MEVEQQSKIEAINGAEFLTVAISNSYCKDHRYLRPKEKIRKSDMPLEAITDAIHEYMYQKINDSLQTEEEKKTTT